MAISIVVPQLGESVAEGTVAKWLKAVGDKVRKEEPLVEIQTDKINVEIPSPADGVLASIVIAEGTTVLVGTEIGSIDAAGGAAAAPAPAAAAPAAAPAAAAPAAAAVAPAAVSADFTSTGGGTGSIESRTLSPAVRRIMGENNVSLAEVKAIRGSGSAGRVTRDDLLGYLKTRTAARSPLPRRSPPRLPPPRPPRCRRSCALPSAPPPRARARRRSRSRAYARSSPTTWSRPSTRPRTRTASTSATSRRSSRCAKEWAPKLEKQGVKLTYMPFFIKAAVLALKEFPWMNGSVNEAGDAMVIKHYQQRRFRGRP
ncbi:MAG: E3 binding domain-containing protein [Candidatus Eisenbacteria bacterium]|nr:E3 binding domain-containing protein [Candidatus Eisenbacteria bacterium]